ncbi:MarR family transcriptional regulator [Sulfitobacter sp. D35]|uniref:MarR family winged helix-turn-helix transcriptional regulator n=1 Tax=Sulfitobacter sp. D35 TaxID=3083252 RepID=UPI00296FA57A|nr:MarR family transcriptional regulator [Sulfitobacter sp. D35]MDW4500052.1 MarR family transcriptional regulator [Sulfitobacter sp. D35]
MTATAPRTEDPTAADAVLYRFTGYAMKRAYMRVQDAVSARLSEMGLRIGTFSALGVVATNPGISQSRLSEILQIKRSGIVVVVDELERVGVLERSAVPGDRRMYALSVTPGGHRLWRKAEAAVRVTEAELFATLDAGETEILRHLLAKAARGATADGGGDPE